MIHRIIPFLLLYLSSSILFAQSEDDTSIDSTTWPKVITAGTYIIKVYTPENASYIDLRLKSNSAVSVSKGEEGKPTFGMVWTTSILDVDRLSRMAGLVSITVDEVRFPDNVSEEQKRVLKEVLESEIPKFNFEIPLDVLIDSMETVSTYNTDYSSTPPQIIFANDPSVLVFIDGEPKFKKIDESYSAIENSAYFIFKEEKTNSYYLKGGNFWYTSDDPTSNWKSTTSVPNDLEDIYSKISSNESENETEEKDNYEGAPPAIIVTLKPSELINIKGEAEFTPIQNTNLLYIENTESNVFMNIDEQNYYLLISGRWYISKELKNDWEYISSEKLPEDFKKIGKDNPKAIVLANVAGTEEAEDAVFDAQIPQTAEVKKDKQLEQEVKYNGEPEFQKIKGLELEYALNTESSVLKDGELYFLCDNAIWYSSNSPKGPWKVSEERPKEVDDIPAENPQYKTKYVYIYETTPSVVYVGYTPGYYGSYVYGPTVVYGTGYYYNPWYGGYYYHHPYSYGMSMSYNSMYGWSIGFSFGSPYGWYGHSYYGRSYYRPPYYRGGYYRHPVHYRNTYRAGNGVNRYQRPNTRPTNPNTRPNRPNRPSTRPNRPSTQPSTRPNRPSTQPSTRPSRPSTQPSTRPSRPSTQPSTRPSYPSTRPSTRPSNNYSRPTTRPSAPMNRPSARPMARPGGMRRR